MWENMNGNEQRNGGTVMRRRLLAVLVLLCFTSVTRAVSTVDALVHGTLLDNDNVLWYGAESGSRAVAEDRGGYDEDIDSPTPPDEYSAATASVGDALAVAGTEPGSVAASVYASPAPGSWARSYAWPYQSLWFQALQDGYAEFTAEFTMAGSLATEFLGDRAFMDGSLGLLLSGGTNPDPVYFEYRVENGSSLVLPDSPIYLTAGGVLEAGQWYELWISVDASAAACSVPAPGALLLGTFGTGVIGLLRRHKFR